MVSMIIIYLAIWTRVAVEMASDGAKESACASMFPMHYAEEQLRAPPYELQVSSTTYRPSSNISVLLRSNEITGFKGFLCQPRHDLDKYITFGKLTPSGDVSMTNNCKQAASLTHTNASRKSSISFTWTAPAVNSGNIVIICTVVQQFNTFWTNITSPVISFSDTISTKSSSFTTSSLSISTNKTMSTLSSLLTDNTIITNESVSITSSHPVTTQTMDSTSFLPTVVVNKTTNIPTLTTGEISSANVPSLVHCNIFCAVFYIFKNILN
ncbi:putative ferric-chelate reductase 1 [Ruditapes philippinarum]|uniref:putative ferric-chelate reductase 1 n=1 Tax=Ruditapes philippinarum TaxID=129788 RepID=UPI00295A6503|nr:putative ferric-chelate reductase 1 [Ruditapes philippinarum]